MIDINQVGAIPTQDPSGNWRIRFGIYLPGITPEKGYRLSVRIIHEQDQFVPGIEPSNYFLQPPDGSELNLWETTVPIAPGQGSFGQQGRYLYRYQLLQGQDEVVTFWFADPFGRASAAGNLSACAIPPGDHFAWADEHFSVPEVDNLVVYELNVREFNRNFQGVTTQLDYLRGLGVNVIELMPVTTVKEDVDWGYTPLGYFAPDAGLGGALHLKELVNAGHDRGIAVIVDSVYAHAHPEFAYNLVYDTTGEPNPMMGQFAGEFFHRPGMDYRKPFTTEYFSAVNRYWIHEYHVDGFRYDYVPGYYENNPVGPGYADLVYRTYESSKDIPRFQADGSRSKIIQCAENLPDPVGIVSRTYSNCCWQNGLLDRARDMARWRYVSEDVVSLLDPQVLGYPTEYRNPASGESFPVAPFQYLGSHDHRRFINEFGELGERDLLGESYGNRDLYYKVQPYVIALYTAKGIPMLWQGEEFVENWGLPSAGLGRNLYERPLHWEYFYDQAGKAVVRLCRIMGTLRRTLPALSARSGLYPHDDPDLLRRGVVAYRRGVEQSPNGVLHDLVVAVNFTDSDAEVRIPFPDAGRWTEQIDGASVLEVAQQGQSISVQVPSNYGVLYKHA